MNRSNEMKWSDSGTVLTYERSRQPAAKIKLKAGLFCLTNGKKHNCGAIK